MTNFKTHQSEKPLRRRGRPPKTEVSLSREALLDHAFKHFAEHGFDGASIREMAAELRVSDSLFHHYFGGKEQLWSEAVSQVMSPLMKEALAALHQRERIEDPLLRLRESTRVVLGWGVSHRRVFQLLFREGGQDSERGALLRQFFDAFQQEVDAALQEASRQGRLREIPLNSAHAMIAGAVRMLADPGLMQNRMQALLEDEAALMAFLDGIVDTLFWGLLKEPPPRIQRK